MSDIIHIKRSKYNQGKSNKQHEGRSRGKRAYLKGVIQKVKGKEIRP